MDLAIKGKTALVFGAGGGLGGAIAKALAAEGANIVLADISAEALSATANNIKTTGAQAMSLTWDIADLSVIDAHIGAVEQRFGSVDILVNNTGGPPPTPASGQSPEPLLESPLWR